ncbi:hypothetical protein SKAU_G00064840 [Synaphobranchus kaupii]|uniref:Uncharacterized protein n=1 Tax=Synaphobranchus kaupii TaxID=118154 RepID=A0A9Q1G5K8_SYNKA|nr:hypothetical protein SKAU_G00064840 [Synaphobranchus kaupii]
MVTEDETLEENWGKIKEVWIKSCEESVGRRKRQNKPWITQTTLEKIEDRKKLKNHLNSARTRGAKAKYQHEYREKHLEVRRFIRRDKRLFTDEMATKAETAASQGKMKELYDITKTLSGKHASPEKPVKDKNGRILTTSEDQMKRWAEHFRELLNRPAPEERMPYKYFRLRLVKELIQEHPLPRRSTGGRPCVNIPLRLTGRHFPSFVPPTEAQGQSTRRHCRVCLYTT